MSQIGETRPQTAGTISTWVGFATMCLGMFMAILDVQVVATSLPTIQSALSIAPDQMSWIQTAYLIAEVIAIPLTGFLTRTLSMRWLFVGAVVLFTVASMGCAASASFHSLIVWRVVQGFAGGTLIPSVFSAVFILFPTGPAGNRDNDRRRAGRSCSHDWTRGRRLDYSDLFLALAFSHQRDPGLGCRRSCNRDGAKVAHRFGQH